MKITKESRDLIETVFDDNKQAEYIIRLLKNDQFTKVRILVEEKIDQIDDHRKTLLSYRDSWSHYKKKAWNYEKWDPVAYRWCLVEEAVVQLLYNLIMTAIETKYDEEVV